MSHAGRNPGGPGGLRRSCTRIEIGCRLDALRRDASREDLARFVVGGETLDADCRALVLDVDRPSAVSGPISRPRAPVTRIRTRSSDSSSAIARTRPASVVTSQVKPAPAATRTRRWRRAASESISFVASASQNSGVKLRCTRGLSAGLGDRLRDVDADAHEWQPVAQADARGILERVAEVVDRIAGIDEHGRDEIPRQVALQLDAAGHEVACADAIAVLVHRRQFLVLVAAHAAVAAGEKTVLGRKLLELADGACADLAAELEVPAIGEPVAALVAHDEAREVGVGSERGRRA